MLKFISFGSGSSGNCYFLFTETDGLLIDSGISLRMLKRYFQEYGLKTNLIHQILVTHDHADHVKSVGAISTELNIPVYATLAVHKGIENNYCVRRKVMPINAHFINKGECLVLGEFHVTPFFIPHDSCDNVGYFIEYQGVSFCLMTDVGHVTDEMKKYIADTNYLVLETNHDEEMLSNGPYPQYLKERVLSENGHLSNKDCAIALAENATQKLVHVWLCHLSEENNHPELARKTVEFVLNSYGISTGRDFMLDVLKRKTPSDIFELK